MQWIGELSYTGFATYGATSEVSSRGFVVTAEPVPLTILAPTDARTPRDGGRLSDHLLDDEPRFDYPVEIQFTCSDLLLIFDKQERIFLLKCENDEGVSVKLILTLHELEHAAIELLLAARGHLGLKPAGRISGRMAERSRSRW